MGCREVNAVLTAICRNGPLHGKVRANQSRRLVPDDKAPSFYVYVPAKGPSPAEWRWIEAKKEPAK